MRIIDNVNIRLIDVLESTITATSRVYYSGDYFTSYSLFSLLPIFKNSLNSSIKSNDILYPETEIVQGLIESETENKYEDLHHTHLLPFLVN